MKPRLLPLYVAFVALPAFAQPGGSVNVSVSLTKGSTGLELAYEVPPSCASLAFVNDGILPPAARELRSDWKALDDCAEVDGKEIRRTRASCTRLRFEVPATKRNLDRVYPWAYPVGGGLFSHTSAFAVAPSCGPVQWTFTAQGGTVIVDGEINAASARRAANARDVNELPLVLLEEPPSASAGKRLHLDPHLSKGANDFIASTVSGIRTQLASSLPGLAVVEPYVVVSGRDAPGYRGDVAHRTVMRLDFPANPAPKEETTLRGFLTHEMAHLAQPSDWNDAWREQLGPSIHEGGAEFLRWTTQARLGWLDRAGLKEELERAFNECAIAAGNGSWSAIGESRKWGRNPYACGLAFHVVALSARADKRPALLLVRDYYREAQLGHQTDFARALECGANATCQPSWLPRLAGSESLDVVLTAYARTPGAVLRPAANWSPATARAVALHHMQNLMKADCNGAVSFYSFDDRVEIAPAKCGTLRDGMVVIAAEGLPLFSGSEGALALGRACVTSGRVTLGLKDGAKVELACGRSVQPLPQLYEVDADAAVKLLVD